REDREEQTCCMGGGARCTILPSEVPILLGITKESADQERRVAVTPDAIARIAKLGFEVVIESQAGAKSGYGDEAYREGGARVVAAAEAWAADVVVAVRPPAADMVTRLKRGAVLIAQLQPADNAPVVEMLRERGVTAIALDRDRKSTR